MTDHNLQELKQGLKLLVFKECNVKGVTPDQVKNSEPIIGGPTLPLDSLDAVEVVSALERHFGIRLESAGESRHLFKSFDAMAEYVATHAAKERIESFLQKSPLN